MRRNSFLICCFGLLLLLSCKQQKVKSQEQLSESYTLVCDSCITIKSRFNSPPGFVREALPDNTFAKYLRNLPLKNINEPAVYFNGKIKSKTGIYISVVDMDIDAVDLQQCADAVMRLKAEYHYANKEYEKIHFNFISDGNPRFYKDYVNGDYSYSKFRKYLRYIFSYANTRSLHNEMLSIPLNSMQIGDVFIQTGNPFGHAVIVVDMVVNKQTGEKLFMLAQSYMPAQETQILINPENSKISPWYQLKEGKIQTPEWLFSSEDLRRFKN